MPESFVGSGWSFPVRTDSTGSIALSSGDREIAEAIRLILSTTPGERPMRPKFGCAIHERMFGTVDTMTISQIQADVIDAVTFWEPRVNILDVNVRIQEDQHRNQLFMVDVTYAIKGSNDRRNLVYPFYMIPEE